MNIDFLFGTWHWAISGFLIGLTMLIITYFGKSFGMSTNLRTFCSLTLARNKNKYFNINLKKQYWNITIVIGSILGGFLAYYFLMDENQIVKLNESTIVNLKELNIDYNKSQFAPDVIFSINNLGSIKSLSLLVIGGFLIGFGTAYGGGCTSGHAITGLSNLQIPSLIAVIGFFIGGLISAHLIIPYLFSV